MRQLAQTDNEYSLILRIVEFSKEKKFIFTVSEDEAPIKLIIDEGVNSFIPNEVGPDKYLTMYEKYSFIQNGDAERELEAFMGQDPFPYLKARIPIKENNEHRIILNGFCRTSRSTFGVTKT